MGMSMTRFADDMRIGFKAALTDISENLFRPVHNIRVVLGLEKEPSLQERVERERQNERTAVTPGEP